MAQLLKLPLWTKPRPERNRLSPRRPPPGIENSPISDVAVANATDSRGSGRGKRRRKYDDDGVDRSNDPNYRFCNRRHKSFRPISEFTGNRKGCTACLNYDKECRDRGNQRRKEKRQAAHAEAAAARRSNDALGELNQLASLQTGEPRREYFNGSRAHQLVVQHTGANQTLEAQFNFWGSLVMNYLDSIRGNVASVGNPVVETDTMDEPVTEVPTAPLAIDSLDSIGSNVARVDNPVVETETMDEPMAEVPEAPLVSSVPSCQ
jgi:hypothetical protein